jgi:hypothetical protein
MKCTSLAVACCLALLVFVAAEARIAAPRPVALFNGTDLGGWKIKGDEKKNYWVVGRVELDEKDQTRFKVTEVPAGADGGPAPRVLINSKGGGVDLYTEQAFGDCLLEIEFMIPKGSNSGIYLMGEYEVQIFDSFGKEKLGQGDLGAIYSAAAPKINAAKKPGEWQKFVIEFRAPRFEGDKKVENAKFVKVMLNDQIIHENVEVSKSTGGGLTGKEAATGPLMLQGDHGPVAFRNITITPVIQRQR